MEPRCYLTKAERAIFDLVLRGHSNKEIAEVVCSHENTVKFHLTKVFKKELVKSRSQLIAKYHRPMENGESVELIRASVRPELRPLCDHLITLAKSMQLIEQSMETVNKEIRFILKNDLVSRDKSGYRDLPMGKMK